MILYGAGGHGKVVKEIIEACGGSVEAFVDDNPARSEFAGLPVIHDIAKNASAIVSIGENQTRRRVARSLEEKGVTFETAIHPNAVVSPSARIGVGTVVMAGAVINANAVIGNHCIINTGATVDHDCVICDFCHVAPGVNISGTTHVGEGTWVGVGTCVIHGLTIGKNCMIGAGSVVVKDLPDGVLAYGNPARVIKYISKCQVADTLNVIGGGEISPFLDLRCAALARSVA